MHAQPKQMPASSVNKEDATRLDVLPLRWAAAGASCITSLTAPSDRQLLLLAHRFPKLTRLSIFPELWSFDCVPPLAECLNQVRRVSASLDACHARVLTMQRRQPFHILMRCSSSL